MSDIGIFIRTYDKDAHWLERSLPTLVENCRAGYGKIMVVGVPGECDKVALIADKNGANFCIDPAAGTIYNGYINQQFTKMRADLFMPTYQEIMFIDADTFCLEPHDPKEVWYKDGKIELLYSRWEDVGDAKCWKMPTELATGIEAQHEYMRRLPQVYPSWLLKATRDAMRGHTQRTFIEYMRGVKTISEFNVIGNVAYGKYKEMFHWTNPQDEGIPYHPFKQCFSRGDIDKEMEKE